MGLGRGRRDRGNRKAQRRKPKKTLTAPKSKTTQTASPSSKIKPSHQIPTGAVLGDVSQQVFCPICHEPKHYYLDISKTCVQCGRDFVFSAHEQKFWYETLKFHFDSTTIRCLECRRRNRGARDLSGRLAQVIRAARENPNDSATLLVVAQTTVSYFQITGHGDLNRAISAARQARRLSPNLKETWFWEALAQEGAGHIEKARAAFTAFHQWAKPIPRFQTQVQQTEERLKALDSQAATPPI